MNRAIIIGAGQIGRGFIGMEMEKAGYHVTGLPPKTPGICDRCGATLVIRKDDNPETIANRLRVYAEQTAPLVDYYAQRGLLVTVPAAGPVDQTAETICRDILA